MLTDYNMLLTAEEGIRGGICQAIHHYATVNNKYMKNYNKNVMSPYLQYLDANNLYGWAMCKTLPIREFKWSKPKYHTEDNIKNYDENSDYGALLEVDVEYPVYAKIKHEGLAFLPERSKTNKVEKLVTTLED